MSPSPLGAFPPNTIWHAPRTASGGKFCELDDTWDLAPSLSFVTPCHRLMEQAVRETAVGSPGGRHETVTLQAETTTPRARTLSTSFVRERTPSGELPPTRRQRMKNEGKARVRALLRLNPVGHERYLVAERARKKDAALRAARGELIFRHAHNVSAIACDGDVDRWANAGPPDASKDIL